MRTVTRGTAAAVLLSIIGAISAEIHARTLVLVDESVRESTVFDAIIEGASDVRDVDVRYIAPTMLRDRLGETRGRHDAVVIVGRSLIEAGFTVPEGIAVLLGGFYGSIDAPPGTRSISLNVDPSYALEQLDKTGAVASDIWSVVTPARATDRDVTALRSIDRRTAHVTVARGERETARAWFDALQEVDPPRGVIVVVDDSFLDSSGTWRFLTERAWRDEIVVVSTIPSYARRGVAIGFIPDLRAYGRLLARSAREMAEDPDFVPESLLDAATTQRVFNRRTLEHVGRRLPIDLDRLGRDDIVIE